MHSQLFVLTTASFMMMDQKTLILKSRIPLTDVAGFTVSPYSDGIVVILLKKVLAQVGRLSQSVELGKRGKGGVDSCHGT